MCHDVELDDRAVMHEHHNHTAQYFQFGAVILRGRGGQQTGQ